jgi:hypothetical protein
MVRFGATSTEAAPVKSALEDVDGVFDMVLQLIDREERSADDP